MKTIFPKNIKKGFLSGMSFQIGPLTISIIQLFILAIGIAISLTIFNAFSKSGSKTIGLLSAILIIIIFLIIAFFKISELGLVQFIAKIIRNNFFDTKKKIQNNYNKSDKLEILEKEAREGKKKQKIEYKTKDKMKDEEISKIKSGGII